MESQMFDIVQLEEEKTIARFNRFRGIARFWQIFELVVLLGLITWSTVRVPAVLKSAAGYLVEFSTYLFNHHVVFLIGNSIIVLLFVLCRQNNAVNLSGCGGDFYDDYLKHSEAAHHREPDVSCCPPVCGDEEKRIVVCTEETIAIPQCDDVAAAIDMATRQIKRFQRTQSEKLKREIAVRPQPKLRRSETQAADIESLSSEEFRHTVDAFIDKHWVKQKTKQNQFEDHKKYHLLKMAY